MKSLADRIRERTGLPDELIKEAFEIEEKLRSDTNGDREEALCTIAFGLDFRPGEETDAGGAEELGKPVQTYRELLPDTRVTAQALLEALQPEIEQLRTQLFEGPEPPFADDKIAAEWIKRAARRESRSLASEKRSHELRAELRDTLTELEELTQVPWRARPVTSTLRYLIPGETATRCTGIPAKSPLLPLKNLANKISKRTGMMEGDAVSYVLTGGNPVISRIHFQHAVSSPGPQSRVTITFNAQNVSWKDMRAAYAEIQEARGGRATLIDVEDEAIWNAVRDLGGVPEATGMNEPWRTRTAFWEEVARQLKKQGLASYKTWNGAMMRWRRLMENHPWLRQA